METIFGGGTSFSSHTHTPPWLSPRSMIPRVMAPGQSVDRTLAGRRGSWKNRLFPFFFPPPWHSLRFERLLRRRRLPPPTRVLPRIIFPVWDEGRLDLPHDPMSDRQQPMLLLVWEVELRHTVVVLLVLVQVQQVLVPPRRVMWRDGEEAWVVVVDSPARVEREWEAPTE